MRNLHVVFTMNPSESGLHDRAATSPALFNRCVLDWFGDWSNEARYQIGLEFTNKLDLENANYHVPACHQFLLENAPETVGQREVLVNAFVHIHTSVQNAARKLLKRNGVSTHITPRHYIEFINQYVAVTNEKRNALEEQQLHLNVGLRKIRETVEQVEEMQKTLAQKSQLLNAKNEAANAKLKQMVQDQQAAEAKKVTSIEIGKELDAKKIFINEKQSMVVAELAGVEPAIEEAKAAVSTIKKAHLTEIRALANPPKAIKLALESILCLLGERQTEWSNIRSFIVRDDFVQLITEFNSEAISDKTRKEMESLYLSNPDYSYEAANRASKACGPLVKWAIAQVNYAGMLLKIEPLRNELKSIQKETTVLQAQADEVQALVSELEKSIAAYKDEYAILISEAQAIKTDLAQVTDKVDRSRALLSKLDVEKDRWAKGSEDFTTQMRTLATDVLICTAYQTYCGYFDQKYRAGLLNNWMSNLSQARLEFKSDISIAEFLSNPEERQRWKTNNLPADDLCTENAIMLKRCIRFPLVIDPSGQATEFLLKEFSDRKITKTSFLDSAFRKNLESALRFGNPLLVQDAESYDPILNPVLNREVRRTGGRVLITIGDQDIDLSPAFRVLLTTRNPSVEFSPDLCSRVTIVNFTVTPSSLQTQCLNKVLRCERPDVDTKRSDLLKLQGEFRLRLHQLESELLNTLNEAKGSILEDDRVITQLEKLKGEATEITRKAAETDVVIAEVEAVSLQYLPLAVSCTNVFFTLEQLHTVHFLYNYSLQFFLDIFNFVLTQNPNLKDVKTPHDRLRIITLDLFHTVFERVAPGLLHDDRIALALSFASFKVANTADQFPETEYGFFLKGSSTIVSSLPDIYRRIVPSLLSEEQARSLFSLSQSVPVFKDIATDLSEASEEVKEFLQASRPEEKFPPVFGDDDDKTSQITKDFRELLLLQVLRSDRVLTKAHSIVDSILGKELMESAERASLDHAVESEVKSNTPILLCGVSGYDPSTHVNDLATALNKQCTSIAIGSAEVSIRCLRLFYLIYILSLFSFVFFLFFF
jgi:dynein heavy chain 1